MDGDEEDEEELSLTVDEFGVIPYDGTIDTSVRSFPNALSCLKGLDAQLQQCTCTPKHNYNYSSLKYTIVRIDCQTCHSALSKTSKGGYSEGTTFWMPAGATPRCSIEYIVSDLFTFHSRDAIFNA